MPNAPKFLVVDDDTAIRKTLSDVLEAKGFDVVAVGSGLEAIEKVRSQSFCVAIIDIRLPDIKGTEVLRQIKGLRPEVSCIIVTAYPEEDPAKALNLGASDFFIKPIDLDRMLNAIQKMISA